MAWSTLVFVGGLAAQKTGFVGRVIRPLLRTNIETVRNYARAQFVRPARLDIDLAFEDLRVLDFHRERALEQGSVFTTDDSWVRATVRSGGNRHRVRMRLKGDTIQHLQGDKWSFRVDLRGGDTIFGMRRFSLHHPAARNYLAEWVYHRAMLRENIIGLRYEFVEVSLNGDSLGVYALEEHFDKQLVEHNKRREGPILRFDEQLMWRQVHNEQIPFSAMAVTGTGDYLASGVDGFRTGQALADPVLREQYLRGAQLLESFRREELRTSEVFDVSLLAKYLALVDLLGAEHGSRWHNIRLYYNPITGRLEPIAFDGQCSETLSLSLLVRSARDGRGRLIQQRSRFHETIFRDLDFTARYLEELERLAKPEYLDSMFADLSDEMETSMSVLHREFPHLRSPESFIRRNQAYLRTMLSTEFGIRAFVESVSAHELVVSVGNLHVLPVQVREFDSGVTPADEAAAGLRQPVLDLAGRRPGEQVRYQVLSIPLHGDRVPQEWDVGAASLVVGVLGTKATANVKLTPHPSPLAPNAAADLTHRAPNVGAFPFIRQDTESRQFRISAGAWRLDRDLVIPAGWTLTAGPGTRLELAETACLISYSPVEFVGAEDAPVEIVSPDGGGSMIILQAGGYSRLEHVHFEGLSAPLIPGSNITGAVNFYESPVSLSHVEFRANTAEDSLNVVRTEFAVDDVTFWGATSDALDADFCQGRISNCRFFDTGNDAIDVSGSTIVVDNVLIDGAGDKAISAGESSDVIASELVIRHAGLALASKDNSTLVARGVVLVDCEWSVAAFQKKSEFGPAAIRVSGVEYRDMEVHHLVERGSTATIDGLEVPAAVDENIKAILYDDDADAVSAR